MKAAVFLSQLLDQFIQSLTAFAPLKPVPNPFLHDRLDGRKVALANSQRIEIFQVLGGIHNRRIGTGAFAHDLHEFGRELVHHHTAVFAIGNLGGQRRDRLACDWGARQAFGLVVRLHLGHQLGVATLRLDNGRDA